MKLILQDDNYYVCRFDGGEEIMGGILDFCGERAIDAGSFTAIGACGELVLSYYNIKDKKYEDHDIKERLEICGVLGNISMLSGQRIIHAHGTFSDNNLKVIGGHIKKLFVSATAEIMLTAWSGNIRRAHDEETGLNLME